MAQSPNLQIAPEAAAPLHRQQAPEQEARAGLEALEVALRDYRGRIAVVSSFGAESAVLLALVADLDPAVPVLFLDTLQHFPETLAYRRQLTTFLGLRDVRSIQPDPAALADRDPSSLLHGFDADACCALRKVEPLDRALSPFGAWVTGRKRQQAATRAALPVTEWDGDRLKINPIASWTAAMIEAEMRARVLPRHPLAAQGYPSVGCAACTRPVLPGAGPRSGRWALLAKTECGMHRPLRGSTGST